LANNASALDVSTPAPPSAFSNSDLLIWPSPSVSSFEKSGDGDCAVTPLADWSCSDISAAIVPESNEEQPVPAVPPAGAAAIADESAVAPDKVCNKADRGSLAPAASLAPAVPCASSDCR
jgi:hypothetical protein